jgi:molybdate transport system permease protein
MSDPIHTLSAHADAPRPRRPRRGRRRAQRSGALPVVGWGLVVVALTLLVLPLVGLLLRTPWFELPRLLGEERVTTALRLSAVTSLSALALSTVLGVPLAWVLARIDFVGKRLVRALVILPMVLPPVVGGVALLAAFGRRRLLGRALEAVTGVTLPFTTTAAVLAATFVAMPFLVITVEAGLRSMDRRYEDAAATLGASRWTVFRRVTVPLLAPALTAGMALAWARALGEFGATITFAGNLPGRTQTIPLAVYVELERDPDAAIALSVVLLAVSIAVLVALRDRYLGVRS